MKDWKPWINFVSYTASEGKLRTLYDRIKGPNDNVDNIMMVHSLRPHSLEGHMVMYKNVLHHTSNSLPKWLLELTGVYVSLLNACGYCVEHHFNGLKRLLHDDARANTMRDALERDALEQGALGHNEFSGVFDARETAILRYAEALTKTPASMTESRLQAMREVGLSDGEILEINQVVSYFAYANRTVLGLGVTTDGDILGLSPNASDGDDWKHQ
jgi:uncharacterized peroxidase-related enzyme